METKIKENWFTWLIILQPVLDIIAYFQQDNIIGSMAGYSRLLIMVILPVCVLFKTEKKKSFFAWLMVIGAYCLLHIANCFRVGYISIAQDVAYLARVIQMPVLTLSFIYYFDQEQVKFNHLVPKAFYINCITIFITMIVAHLTGTASWSYEIYKVGLKGWFANSNAQSIIIVSIIPFVLHYVLHLKKKMFLIVTTIFSWFLLISNGTRVAYYAIFIIYGGYLLFIIFEYFLKRKDGKKLNCLAILMFVVVIIVSCVGYKYTPRYHVDSITNTARVQDSEKMEADLADIKSSDEGDSISLEELLSDPVKYQAIVEYYTPLINEDMVNKFGIERVLRYYGYLPDAYQLSDMRLKKVVFAKLIWEDCDLLTKLVGFEYTNMVVGEGSTFDLENDYPALFYYYGYIGIGLYFAFIAYFVFRIIYKVFGDFKNSINSFNFALLLTFAIQLFAAQLSGAILRRPNVSIYLSITLMLIYFQTKVGGNRKERSHESVISENVHGN